MQLIIVGYSRLMNTTKFEILSKLKTVGDILECCKNVQNFGLTIKDRSTWTENVAETFNKVIPG